MPWVPKKNQLLLSLVLLRKCSGYCYVKGAKTAKSVRTEMWFSEVFKTWRARFIVRLLKIWIDWGGEGKKTLDLELESDPLFRVDWWESVKVKQIQSFRCLNRRKREWWWKVLMCFLSVSLKEFREFLCRGESWWENLRSEFTVGRTLF